MAQKHLLEEVTVEFDEKTGFIFLKSSDERLAGKPMRIRITGNNPSYDSLFALIDDEQNGKLSSNQASTEEVSAVLDGGESTKLFRDLSWRRDLPLGVTVATSNNCKNDKEKDDDGITSIRTDFQSHLLVLDNSKDQNSMITKIIDHSLDYCSPALDVDYTLIDLWDDKRENRTAPVNADSFVNNFNAAYDRLTTLDYELRKRLGSKSENPEDWNSNLTDLYVHIRANDFRFACDYISEPTDMARKDFDGSVISVQKLNIIVAAIMNLIRNGRSANIFVILEISNPSQIDENLRTLFSDILIVGDRNVVDSRNILGEHPYFGGSSLKTPGRALLVQGANDSSSEKSVQKLIQLFDTSNLD